jgi:hypothetical protein
MNRWSATMTLRAFRGSGSIGQTADKIQENGTSSQI